MSSTDRSTFVPRLGVVLLAVAAAAAGWAVEVHALKINLAVGTRAATATHVSLSYAVFAGAFAGLAAWALLAQLERYAKNPARTWTIIAACVFVVSLLGPAGAVTTAAKAGLMCLHALVALVLIVGLRQTASATSRRQPRTV